MLRFRSCLPLTGLAGLLLAGSLLGGVAASHAQGIAVIAHPSVPAVGVSHGDLLALYSREEAFWDDERDLPVRVFNLTGPREVTKAFYEAIGRTTVSRMKTLWLRQKLAGEGEVPESLAEEEMIRRVQRTPGAVGFVRRSSLRPEPDLKVLLVIEE